MKNYKLLTDSDNFYIADKISKKLGISLVKYDITKFSDGEIAIKNLPLSLHNKTVFIIKSTAPPVNENYFELFFLIDALRRYNCKIICVLPYMGYQRQDRLDEPIESLNAKVITKIIECLGVETTFVVDLHQKHIQGFFNNAVVPIDSNPYISQMIKDKDHIVISATDGGGYFKVSELAKLTGYNFIVPEKKRIKNSNKVTIKSIEDVNSKDIVIVDDIISSGNTLIETAKKFKESGAKEITCFCTHFVGDKVVIDNIENSCIDKLFIFDTNPNVLELNFENTKIQRLEVADIIIPYLENYLNL